MKLRGVLTVILLAVLFGASACRLIAIYKSEVYSVSSLTNTKVIDVGVIRGGIFDVNGSPLVNNERKYMAAVLPCEESKAELTKILGSEEIKSYINKTDPYIIEVGRQLMELNSVAQIKISKRYSAFPSAVHIIGYVDSSLEGKSGMERAFDSFLAENSVSVSARFVNDAAGNALLGNGIEIINNDYNQTAGVYLTINKDVQCAVERNMQKYNIDKGAVVVIDIETGGIAAIASAPVFNPSSPAESLNADGSPFVNRALSAFSVGSVFKPVIAAAALENGIDPDTKFTCEGEIKVGNTVFHCHERSGHGNIDLNTAIEKSCNIYFIKLARQVGTQDVIKTARRLGFGKTVDFASGIIAAGNLPDESVIDSPAALANLSFGQGQLTASPVQIAAMTACIAAKGIYRKPYLVIGTKDLSGVYSPATAAESYRAISEDSAGLICKYLEAVVETGTGKRAGCEKFKAAGKTATAQTGRKNAEGEEICNSWFTGFFPADNPKYAVTVFKEDGGEGAISCAPVFKAIAEEIMK